MVEGSTIFVAGATGLAGSGVIRRLLKDYKDITIIATLHNSCYPRYDDSRVKYVRLNLADSDKTKSFLKDVDFAIMTAASTAGSASLVSEPWAQVNDNIYMYSSFLEACAFVNVKKVVCITSATVYQQFDAFIKENEIDFNIDPFGGYFGVGWVNRYIEKLCEFWYRSKGINFAIGRTSNIYGPYAKFNPSTSNFIPAIIRKAVSKMDPFKVWGSANVVRDVIFVDDFANAVLSILEYKDKEFEIFNIGTGRKVTVSDVVKYSLKYANHKPGNIVYGEPDKSIIDFRALDCSKIKRCTGWTPIYTIEDGIRLTMKWWIDNKEKWKK